MSDTRNNTRALAAIAVGWAAVLSPTHAQEAGRVMIDVADCIKLDTPGARLACYESRVAAVFGERAAQAAVARSAEPTPAAAPTVQPPEPAPTVAEPVQSRGDRQSRRDEKARAAADVATSDLVNRVKELREVAPNAWLITLENGQVWRQTVSKPYVLRAGQQVTIYGTRWGNASRLSADEINGYIQVARVR